ncbi:UPF0547 protein C16orf87 homolog [Orbicella faveolata]|uniref:UPF0547 protein C16orf87 homolog n=1 Tax=Orbicella faveolata TaxID=48498 RepID=UPI0009E5DF9F|nr:UPF0547 protein C16orf87 homolog [Orbicella faveolata]
MVLRQCLACNTTVLGTLQICTCGHVFEDIRQIGGKRFSEYRASLYTRLEAKRSKPTEENKANRPSSDSDSTDGDSEKQIVVKPKKSRPTLPSSRTPRRTKGKRKKGNLRLTQDSYSALFQSPEDEAARFSRALQEINRRLMGQSMAWLF